MAHYQLLVGHHASGDKKYTAGDIVETDSDLVNAFGSSKFRRLSDAEVADCCGVAMQTEAVSTKPTTSVIKRKKKKLKLKN